MDVDHSVASSGLPEPARQRLLAAAADVLGTLGPDAIPSILRPFARFAPARRARLAAGALAAALDADEAFRTRVAQAVAEARPELAAALRADESTALFDPVDVAVLAYLLRPDGWPQRLVQLSADRTADPSQVTALRGELAQLHARARADSVAARRAVEEATQALSAEVVDLRRQLRIRTGDLRAAERTRDQALAAVITLQAQAAAAEAARDVEARRTRARISDLEATAEAARRGGRTERDLDDARLWLLVDSVTEAAAGIRRELSLAAPRLSPADSVGAADQHSADHRLGDRRVAEAASLTRVLSLPHAHLVVDGYNVTKTGYDHLPLADQRARLVASSAALVSRLGVEVTVAFDGGPRPPVQPAVPRGVRVLFSAEDEIADDLIRRLVAAEPLGRTVVVASSDQQVALDVRQAGAWSVPAAVLLEVIGGSGSG